MAKIIIVGAGGVGNVVAHKCAKLPKLFDDILIVSRTLTKCNEIASNIFEKTKIIIRTAVLDADDLDSTVELLKIESPNLLINVALPYQDLKLMEACLRTGVNYLDTANYEPIDEAKFEYKWQWAYQKRYKQAGIIALLGSGFDPGVTNVFCAYAQKHIFDQIETIDILDANAGDHGYHFATNFNPEINIREITAKGRYWEKGKWKEVEPVSIHRVFDFPVVGKRDIYLLYHEELESLTRYIKGLRRIRFWMTFSKQYLNYLKVLENVGMTSIKPIDFKGHKIKPIEFLKTVLPDPASLGERTKGKTCIGCDIVGEKNGQKKRIFIFNSCDHQECFREASSQAISYTTGTPAMIGAKMMLKGIWKEPGVWNLEQLDPDPFMVELKLHGLPWQIIDLPLKNN